MAKKKKASKPKAPKGKCYTFICTYHDGLETIVKGSRRILNDADVKEINRYSLVVTETKEHISKECNC